MEVETLFCFTIGMLRDLLIKEGVYLQALKDPVEELHKKLTQMEELLEYAHVRRDKRTKAIIELADRLMDSIEKYVFRVVSKIIGVRERLLRSKVGLAIENVITKINDLINSQSGNAAGASSSGPRRMYKVQDLSYFNEKEFVGREEDINKLVSFLVDEESEQFRVISIYGMGGLGKTTLAKIVYKENKVRSHFKSFAYVCVSEQCQGEEILKHILQQLVPKNEAIKDLTSGDVIERLQRVLGENKCLVIIDDIWSVCDWESLNRGLCDGCAVSKVLLTTRIKDVADKGFCYSLRCLSEKECWGLFQTAIFTTRDPQVGQRVEELGRKMIEWCRGIPLAVLVLRGVLVTKGSLPEWERFYESKTWGGENYKKFNDEVAEELSFSYKELPYPLKPCFLYLANFAENKKIESEMLYRLWEAEGMILSNDREAGETMMDVGERYLGELVGRSLVEAELEEEDVHSDVRRRYKFCWLHDFMRELCLAVVEKDKYLKLHDHHGRADKVVVLNSSCLIMNETDIPARQAMHFLFDQEFSVHGKQEANRHVRSLLFDEGSATKLSNLKKLSSLRVLSFSDTNIGKEDFTNDLIHLRYLSLNHCKIRKLPSSVRNLIYLQTLDIRVFGVPPSSGRDILIIPNVFLRKLKRLKHLFLPDENAFQVTPKFSKLRLDGLTELETLVNLDSTLCENKDVTQLTSLTRLEWKIQISSQSDCEEFKEVMEKANLDPSGHSKLAIVLDNPEVEIYSDILRGEMPQCCERILRELNIQTLRGNLSPNFLKFSQLTILTLLKFEVEEDRMPILEKLANLQRLSFIIGKLKGKEMTCSTMGFPQLRHLNFSFIENLEEWRVEEGAMPNLISLTINRCPKLLKEMLKELPKFITTLEGICLDGTIYWMGCDGQVYVVPTNLANLLS